MGFTIRALRAECKFCQAWTVEALGQVIPAADVRAAAGRAGRPGGRVRKLTLEVTLWLVIALHLFPRHAIPAVLRQLARGQRLVWDGPDPVLPGAAALVYRRSQLGARPVAALFHAVCRPLATPQTPGAYRFGLRLVGLDGTVESVPDTPANARAFGRRRRQRGPSASPQVLAVYVVELGTHAVFEAGFWPGASSEHPAARRLVRALEPGRLALWDRGFHSVGLIRAVRARGAHVLGRLPAHVRPQVLRHLPDGSALASLRPPAEERSGRDDEPGVLVRLVADTLAAGPDGVAPRDERDQLVTTLLDPAQAPAATLAATDHERWEVEVTIDELDTPQRLATRPRRSQKPVGVVQELYGLLLAHYVVRALLVQAAAAADLDPDRLSFVHAVQLVGEAIPDFQLVTPAQWPTLRRRLLADLARAVLPERRPRANPRVVRRQSSKFAQKAPGQHGTPRQPDTYDARIALLQPPSLASPAVLHALPPSLLLI
jgi:hypothetical protein